MATETKMNCLPRWKREVGVIRDETAGESGVGNEEH
jgi:hypothetical protein